jgi:L-malate glycosyltransferase
MNSVRAATVAPAAVGRPARVLQLVHSNESGGVEALAASIARGLATQGVTIDTHFLYPAFAVGKMTKIAGILTTIAAIARARPDVLVAYQSTASVLVGVVGRVLGVPTRIVHQTSVPLEVNPIVRILDRWVGSTGFYTANITNSHATEAAFADYPKSYRSGLTLIEHGLRPPQSRATRAQTLARFGIEDRGPILLNAGRLSDQKAQDVIIKALPLIPGAQFVVAGGGPNEAAYRALARDLGVADRTHLVGYVSREDVGDLLAVADAFVFPSRWETFGLAPVEAAMSGVPVVASDLDVMREVLSLDGTPCATFVASDEPKRWAQAISHMVATPDAKTRAAAHAPLLRAKYGEDRMIDAYVRLIDVAA